MLWCLVHKRGNTGIYYSV